VNILIDATFYVYIYKTKEL